MKDKSVSTCVITGYGINADWELAEAFRMAGASAYRVHIKDLIDKPDLLFDYDILAFPGGFSFGDHLGSGLVFANSFKRHLERQLQEFVDSGRLIIGICNGFQVLVKMGALPNLDGNWRPTASLIHNDSGVFEDSWVEVSFTQQSHCVWTSGLPNLELPIRHGEGRFIAESQEMFDKLEQNRLVAVRYETRNPNGSQGNVAGITDPTGQVLGLMPHPEAFLYPENHPQWHRRSITGQLGISIFSNGVEYARRKQWQQ